MSGFKLSGVHTSVAIDVTPGVSEGIAFGAINGKLCIGITAEGKSYFVALAGDVLDAASHKLADALAEIARIETPVRGSIQ